MLLRSAQDLGDGGRQRFPRVAFGFELLLALLREGVKLGAAIIFGRAPLCSDPSTSFEAMQRGVERTLLNAQNIFRDLLQSLRDSPAMLRFIGNAPENQQVECPLRKFDTRRHGEIPSLPLLLRQESTQSLVEAQGVSMHRRISEQPHRIQVAVRSKF
jgi:hypothetical protein